MEKLISIKCFNHNLREAAAKCPECGNFFCRECITEHKGRMLCARCINKKEHIKSEKYGLVFFIFFLIQGIAGFFILWAFFYFLGYILIQIPLSYHEGTIWEKCLQ